jgi:HD-GYP domain-containing protein (c-di-GMP phosphodiesterase class II)
MELQYTKNVLIMKGMIVMEKSVLKLSIDKLEPGMVLAKEIVHNGRILINSGTTINENIIAKLTRNFILNNIFVYSEDEPIKIKDIETIKNITEKSIVEIEENFSEISFDVSEMFQDMYDVGICDINEVKAFSEKIRKELDSPATVIKNIVLHGSGEDYIYRHSVNVAALSSILAKWLDFSENEINLLSYSAILHDLGKTKVDNEILSKNDKLTLIEFEEIKKHAVLSYNLVKQVENLDKSVSFGILMHHERLDGSGYPLGLTFDKIHKFAKVIAIADVFDAVNSNRSYKKKRNPFEAIEVIQKESLGKLDYEYCKVFIDHIINYYIGEIVLLNNGKECRIVQVDINHLATPLLFDGNEFIDLKNFKDLKIES